MVAYNLGQGSLGAVLVAASARGLCAISLGDEPGPLVNELLKRFPEATPRELPELAEVLRFIDAPSRGLETQLDVRGTPFQERVWEALRAIPPGATVTYGELAARLGSPGAVRAVGRACGQNILAVAIPCHRAVPKGGGLAGYRWGVERKRALLDRER